MYLNKCGRKTRGIFRHGTTTLFIDQKRIRVFDIVRFFLKFVSFPRFFKEQQHPFFIQSKCNLLIRSKYSSGGLYSQSMTTKDLAVALYLFCSKRIRSSSFKRPDKLNLRIIITRHLENVCSHELEIITSNLKRHQVGELLTHGFADVAKSQNPWQQQPARVLVNNHQSL